MNKIFFRLTYLGCLLLISTLVRAQSVLATSQSDETIYQLASFNQDGAVRALLQNSDNQQFVAEFDKLYGNWFDFPTIYNEMLTKNVDDWEIALFDARNEQLDYLEENQGQAGITPEFAALLERGIRWNYWHLLLAYPILRSNNDPDLKRMVALPRIMTEDFDLNKLSAPDDLLLPSYRKLLPLAVTYFNSENKKFVKYSDRTLMVKDKSEFAEKYLQGNLLELVNARLVEENCPFLTPTSARYFISNIYEEPLRKHLLGICNETLNRKEEAIAVSKKTDPSLPRLMDLNDKPFDFSAYKGKVIYVDFWASWCGPCRKEMPKSQEMHEALTDKQKKEVVFLYISIDENIDAWKSAVEQLKLAEFGENGHSYEVSGRYGIRSIPRYMLIDRTGTIVEMEATRPSNPETLMTILRLIDKK